MSEVSSPFADDVEMGWLQSFREAGRTRQSDRPSVRSLQKDSSASLISQSADDLAAPNSPVPKSPLFEPADPIDEIEGSNVVSNGMLESEGTDSFLQNPHTEGIHSRPPMTAEQVFSEHTGREAISWQLLPDGLLYKTYLASEKEPRLQMLRRYDRISGRTVDDAVLGGRVGLIRHGSQGAYDPHGFQLDLEGAVFARVLPEEESAMLEGSDYRVGLYGTWRDGPLSTRLGYYHISSHVGDEFLIANPGFTRINYVRDSVLAGLAYETTPSTRVYGELGYAVGHEGGAEPLEFQLGAEYTPVAQHTLMGAPFAAINRLHREEFDFDGGLNLAAGWGWQGPRSGRRLRLGVSYFRGPSPQYVFFDRKEELVGGGIWLDF